MVPGQERIAIAGSTFPELVSRQISKAIVCGVLIEFRKRRIVENHIDERIHSAIHLQHDHPDVNQFRRALANDVQADQLAVVSAEHELQQAVGVA